MSMQHSSQNQPKTVKFQTPPQIPTDQSSINPLNLALGAGFISVQDLQSSLSPILLSIPNNMPVADSLKDISQMQLFDSSKQILSFTNESGEIISNTMETDTGNIVEDPPIDSDFEILTDNINNEDLIVKKIRDDVDALIGDSEVTFQHVNNLVEWMEAATTEKPRKFILDRLLLQK
jgi:hypothetical protein